MEFGCCPVADDDYEMQSYDSQEGMGALSWVMSPSLPFGVAPPRMSKATWVSRSCRCCGGVLTGPVVQYLTCMAQVHGQCCAHRAGMLVCNLCANEYDFMRAHSRAQANAFGFSRALGAGGAIAGHAIGAMATVAVGGATRLVGRAGQGARQALGGLMMPTRGRPPQPFAPQPCQPMGRMPGPHSSVGVEDRSAVQEEMESSS